MRPFHDYNDMEQDDRTFVLRLMFHDFLSTVDFNRRKGKGPQFIRTIINNDMQEHIRLQNFEACIVLKDMSEMFKEEIDNHDDLL